MLVIWRWCPKRTTKTNNPTEAFGSDVLEKRQTFYTEYSVFYRF